MNKSHLSVLVLSFLISFATAFAFEYPSEKTLLIFSAKWCRYCQNAKEDMQTDHKLSEVIKQYSIIDVDFDTDKDLIKGYNIKSVPTFVIFDGGKEKARLQGYRSKQHLLNFLKGE